MPRPDWLRLGLLLTLAVAACAESNDPVAQLSRHIQDGSIEVPFDDRQGYLPWILNALQIPAESQIMVFSKTSVQALRIDPWNPRRLYFNDSVIVGSVKGGAVEFAAQDAERGLFFYLMDERFFRYQAFRQDKSVALIAPRSDCVTCHQSKATGLMETLIRSVSTSRGGIPVLGSPVLDTDSRTSFDKLWGGWFVTGKTEARHRGNLVMNDQAKAVRIEPPGSSDIAALMVFEHQMRMMNLLARAAAGRDIDELADYMLFTDEAPLPARVEGTSGFAEKFSARGPRDSKGRSLRDLDLNRRLMKYPCSYMIYSPAFSALPASVRAAVYRRMWGDLTNRDAADRQAVVEILRDTKPDLPYYFVPR